MPRSFKTVDYELALDTSVRLRDCLPPAHLARYVADLIAHLDLTAFYARYAPRGGVAYAPDLLLSLLFYGYATGIFSARKIEAATYDQAPFRFLAGHQHPDHDTLATFRTQFLDLLPAVFQQILLLAAASGAVQVGQVVVSGDGTKIHADASKSKAVSYARLTELETRLQGESAALLARGAAAAAAPVPDGLVLAAEISDREARLANLATAKAVLDERAQHRDALTLAAYEAALAERAATAAAQARPPRGRGPQPPTATGPRPTDQYNFTDPESRIMKNATNAGFEQAYNAQTLVDQASLLIVGYAVSNHPTDTKKSARRGRPCPRSWGWWRRPTIMASGRRRT